MGRIRQHIISIEVDASEALISDISSQLPGDVDECVGLVFSVCDTDSSTPENSYLVGRISLSFNNRASNPVNYSVRSKTFGSLSMKALGLIPMPMKLLANSHVNGFFKDLGYANDYPYRLKVYIFYKSSDGR
jgi:hypothetical protein